MPRKRKVEEISTDIASLPSSSTGGKSKRKRNESQTTVSEPPMEEEKRLARYKPACPQNIRQRVERVMTQRFFMVERNRFEGELREEFKVLGSTSRCNERKSLQTHSFRISERALLSSELAYIFAHAPAAPNSVLNPRIQAAYSKAVGSSTTEDETKSIEKKRKVEEDDSCPVCYEEMHNINEKLLVFCQVCGNGLHKECFQQWAMTAQPVTCVYCRANWVFAEPSGDSNGRTVEGYLNLGAVAGISPVRDTSTYYRGRGYDYDDYDYY